MNYRDFLKKLVIIGAVLFCANHFAQVSEIARLLFKNGEFDRGCEIMRIKNLLGKVKAFYYRIIKNISWASALVYSIMDSFPQYILKNLKSECKMQTLLFMLLARYAGSLYFSDWNYSMKVTYLNSK